MNVHASALAEAHLPDEQTTAFAREAIEDLSRQPKKLSPKYFYDATGSELFEAITRLPEYYPTRTELAILKERGGEIAKIIPEHAALVEFNLCCFGARLTPGHPLQAFGSSTFNRDSRRIESFLVPCACAENYFKPLAAARTTLHMLLRQ